MADGDFGRETTATRPARIGWGRALVVTFYEVGRKNLSHIAAGVAFYMLFSVFPTIAVVISIAGLVSQPQDVMTLVETLEIMLPADAYALVEGQVRNTLAAGGLTLGSTAVVSALLSFWSAGAAVRALMSAMNLAYPDVWSFGVIAHYVLSIVFTVLGLLMLVGLVMLLVTLPIAFRAVQMLPATLGLPQDLGVGVDLGVVAALEWPILSAVGVLLLTLLYRAGAARGPFAWRAASISGVAATLSWIGASQLLVFYVSRFGDLAKTYGPLGAVAGLMLWFWISALILLTGAELARTLAAGRGERDPR